MSVISRKWSALIALNGGVDEYHSPGEVKNKRLRGEGLTHSIMIENKRIKKRPGAELFGPYFYDKCYGFHEYVDGEGVAHLFVNTRQAVKDVSEFSSTDIDTGLAEEELHFHTHRGRCWYNGATTQRKITQTTVSRVGVVAPDTAPTLADGAATGITGNYGFKYSFVIKDADGNVEWESNLSSGASITVTDKKVTVTPAASDDSRVNYRRVYRTTASGNVYQVDGDIANNTAGATYTSSQADALLGNIAENTHTVPDHGIVSEGCNERMFWLVNDNGVAYLDHSEQAHTEGYQEYSPSTNRIRLPSDGKGVGMRRLYNRETDREDLCVFQESGITILPGGEPTVSLFTVSTKVGLKQHDTIWEYNGGLYFMSNTKIVYQLKSGRLVDVSSRSFPKSAKALQNTQRCRGSVIFDHYYAISTQRKVGSRYNDTVWIIDLRTVNEVREGEADAVCFPWYVPYSYMLQRENGDVMAFDESKQRLVKLSMDHEYDEYGDGLFCEPLKAVPLNGEISTATGVTSIQFDLYAAETGGTTLWTETNDVNIAADGAFAVDLNTSVAVPQTVIDGMAAGTKYWLEMTFGGVTHTRASLPKRAFLTAKSTAV